MNAQRILTVAMVVLCVSAVGLAATSLDAALETHPDDVVDFDYDRIPIGKGDAARLQDEVESNSGQDGGGTSPGDGQDRSAGRTDGTGSDESPDASSGQSSDGGGNGDTESVLARGGTGTGEMGTAVSLLERLLPWLLVLLALALAYRYRERLVALVLALGASLSAGVSDSSGVEERWRGVPPSNDVYRAWLAMVYSTPIDRPWTKTPVECADAARESGIDPAVVESVTRAFEEVRYGGRPVTDERRRAAREALGRIQGEPW